MLPCPSSYDFLLLLLLLCRIASSAAATDAHLPAGHVEGRQDRLSSLYLHRSNQLFPVRKKFGKMRLLGDPKRSLDSLSQGTGGDFVHELERHLLLLVGRHEHREERSHRRLEFRKAAQFEHSMMFPEF